MGTNVVCGYIGLLMLCITVEFIGDRLQEARLMHSNAITE